MTEIFTHTDGKKYRIVKRGEANGVIPVHSEVLGVTSGGHKSIRLFIGERKCDGGSLFVTEAVDSGTIGLCRNIAVPVTNEEILKPYAIKCANKAEWDAVVEALGDGTIWHNGNHWMRGVQITCCTEQGWVHTSERWGKTEITAPEALRLCGIDWPDDKAEIRESIARLEKELEHLKKEVSK